MANHTSRFHQFITEHYSLEEIRTLCFDLGIKYENLGGGEKLNSKARELVLWAGKQDKLDQLLAAVERDRPGLLGEAGLGTGPETLEGLYADLASFETSTKPLHRKILDRIGLEQRLGFALLALLIVSAAFGVYMVVRPREP